MTAKPGSVPQIRPLGNPPEISVVEDTSKYYIPQGIALGMAFARLFDYTWLACIGLSTELEQRNLLTDIVYGIILVTLLGQRLTLRVLLPRWKEKLVRAEVEEPLPTEA